MVDEQERECTVPYAPIDENGDVTDGSVEHYDTEWGEPVQYDESSFPYGCARAAALSDCVNCEEENGEGAEPGTPPTEPGTPPTEPETPPTEPETPPTEPETPPTEPETPPTEPETPPTEPCPSVPTNPAPEDDLGYETVQP